MIMTYTMCVLHIYYYDIVIVIIDISGCFYAVIVIKMYFFYYSTKRLKLIHSGLAYLLTICAGNTHHYLCKKKTGGSFVCAYVYV